MLYVIYSLNNIIIQSFLLSQSFLKSLVFMTKICLVNLEDSCFL